MKTFFKPTSKKLPNGKWISRFSIHTSNKEKSTQQDNSFGDVEFNSSEEADSNAINYCLKKGFVQKN